MANIINANPNHCVTTTAIAILRVPVCSVDSEANCTVPHMTNASCIIQKQTILNICIVEVFPSVPIIQPLQQQKRHIVIVHKIPIADSVTIVLTESHVEIASENQLPSFDRTMMEATPKTENTTLAIAENTIINNAPIKFSIVFGC